MSRLIIGATWENAPHLTPEAKEALWNSIPAYQKDSRSKGIPQLAAGSIYTFPETDIKVKDFEIPKHYARGFGLDCALGGSTAMVWGAMDRDSMTLYLYSVYKRSMAETAIHVEALKSRGAWIPGVGDAAGIEDAARTKFIESYRKHKIDLELADKAVEVGIQEVYDMLSAGKLKVFESCAAWFAEFRLYKRDKHGRVKKVNDHLMDATRYLVRSGRGRMKNVPTAPTIKERFIYASDGKSNLSWMR
jgi:hypothetical protein